MDKYTLLTQINTLEKALQVNQKSQCETVQEIAIFSTIAGTSPIIIQQKLNNLSILKMAHEVMYEALIRAQDTLNSENFTDL